MLARLPAVLVVLLLAAAVSGCGGAVEDGAVEDGAVEPGGGPVDSPSPATERQDIEPRDIEPQDAELQNAELQNAEAAAAAPGWAPVPVADELIQESTPCLGCHRRIVRDYLGLGDAPAHGMAASLGSLARPEARPQPGKVVQPRTGAVYRIEIRADEPWLVAELADGGERLQRLVGRIGAGIYDTSWVAEEVDPWSGEGTGRLFFAPVETVTDHGLELSPFDLHEGSPALDMALTSDCLTCHTTSRVATLDEAAAAYNENSVYPPNALGDNAFHQLRAIGCDGCHGDTSRHQAIATAAATPEPGEGLGVWPMAARSAPQRRDVCARCHLQGEARIELSPAPLDAKQPLAGQIPTLVPARRREASLPAEFRFVGQVEQLAQAPCFRASPEMTCTTCHDPHQGVRAQGLESLEAACRECHAGVHPEGAPAGLTVRAVAGRPARTVAGCVDCHMAYAQPVDLPHIETVDHRVRRHLPPVQPPPPHRALLDPEGPLELFYVDPHDDRLDAAFASEAGRRWLRGVTGLGLAGTGRPGEALPYFEDFPPPASPHARNPTAPEGLTPLETSPLFHHVRAVVLQAAGRLEEALNAYGDALALDAQRAEARIARARLRLDLFDRGASPIGVVQDTEVVIEQHSGAEQPWLLRAELALRLERPDMALQAFEEAVERWPSNPGVWLQIARLRRLLERPGVDEAEARLHQLSPSLAEALVEASP